MELNADGEPKNAKTPVVLFNAKNKVSRDAKNMNLSSSGLVLMASPDWRKHFGHGTLQSSRAWHSIDGRQMPQLMQLQIKAR